MPSTTLDLQNLYSFKELAAQGGLSRGTLRYWYYTNKYNFKDCAIQIGSKVFLDKAAVTQWLRDHGTKATAREGRSG